MSLNTIFINLTQREGLLYTIIENYSFKILRFINLIKNGHLRRKYKIKKYLRLHSEKKLHLGCGKNNIENFLNTDIMEKIPIDITKKLPFKNETFEIIYSNHLIEHIYQKEFRRFLKESLRVLKNNGIHIIQTPSLEKIIKILYGDNDIEKQKILMYHKKTSLVNKIYPCNLLNNITHLSYGHKYLYDYQFLKYLAICSGYTKVEKNKNNFELPDKDIKDHLKEKGDLWDLETETYLLFK